MGVSKVVRSDGRTIIDLTGDTVDASTLASGATAHGKDGELVTGALSFSTYYTSSSAPTQAQGSDGDIWLVTS